MVRKFTLSLFTASFSLALIGGIILVLTQVVGLGIGSVAVVDILNGVFKSLVCISASVSAVTAYLLNFVPGFTAPKGETHG